MDKLKIFISHSSHDRDTAKALIELICAALGLPTDGIRCTSVEGHGLPGAGVLTSELTQEAVTAEAFIALLSPESMMSPWVLIEIGARLGNPGKPLLTVLVPGVRAGELPGSISTIHALRCESEADLHNLLQQLAKTLKRRLGKVGSYSRYIRAVKDARRTRQPVSSIYGGFLHLDSTLFHEVEREVRKWMRKDGEIIPTKFLFAHADSYKFYKRLIEEPAYTIAQGNTLLGEKSEVIADYLMAHVARNRALTIVSLGIGFGLKEGHLLGALLEKGAQILLLAIDQNPAFIQAAIARIRDEFSHEKLSGSLHCQFMVGDFDHIDELAALLPVDRPTVFLALGGTFGNQNELSFLQRLGRACKGESYLLMDFDTIPVHGRELNKSGYDSKINKEFISSMFEIFCNERPTSVQALPAREVFSHRVSAVGGPDVADVIVMQGEFKDGRRRIFGYSTRYDKKAVEDFLASESWGEEKEFDDSEMPSISLLLRKWKPKKD